MGVIGGGGLLPLIILFLLFSNIFDHRKKYK